MLALLAIYQERGDQDLTPERVQALHQRAATQIREALAPFGYYRVEVDERLEVPDDPNGRWVASYSVRRGEPVRIGSVSYRITGPGADDPAFPKAFPMQPGDVLLHDRYTKARDEIRAIAAGQGYLDYQLVGHQVLIDPVAYEALIDFHMETGPRYFLGEVRFEQDFLDDDFLQRFVTFEPGVRYDPDLLLRLQGRLLGTEYFDTVELIPRKDEAGDDNVIPIEVVATRNKANKYRFGLGYGTDSGPRATLEWRRRYLTRFGHKLRTELSWSQNIQRLEADYRIPIGNPVRDYLQIRPELLSYDTATRQGDSMTVQFAHSVVTPRGWRRTAGVDYHYEDYQVIAEDQSRVNELVPNVSWAKTVSDDPIFTGRGYRLKYSLLGALEGVVSPHSYLSGTVGFKWVRSFADGGFRFITRTDLGATLAETVLDLPGSRRFFAGGDTSIRGWDIDVLGPRDPDTREVVGGRYLAVGTLELERRIRGDWSAAVFTDFGNAFDPAYENAFEVSAGLGVRWRSPVGQIRVDVAFALTKDDDDTLPARLHFVIGPDL